MDRKKLAEEIMGKLKDDDILKIIKQAEEGHLQVRVKIRVDTPHSARTVEYQSRGFVEKCFGSFYGRPIHVQRIDDLPSKYEHDVAFVEGDWPSIGQLNQKISDLHVVNKMPNSGTLAGRVYAMLKTEFDVPGLHTLSHALYDSDHPNPNMPHQLLAGGVFSDTDGKIPISKACEFLVSKGIECLLYPLRATPDGVYDDRTKHGEYMAPVNETLVANVTFRD